MPLFLFLFLNQFCYKTGFRTEFLIYFTLYLSVTKKWLDYVEAGDELDPSAALRRTSRNMDDDISEMPLGEGMLTRNLGLDVVVVVTKVSF